jgi:hypothetical protein
MERSMTDKHKDEEQPPEKVAVTLPGSVEKIIPPILPTEAEKAQIAVEGADDLYREFRIENTLQDPAGNPVALKVGAEVEVTIEAEPDATTPKNRPKAR